MKTNIPSIEISKITYKGIEYPSREIEVDNRIYLVSVERLSDELIDDIRHCESEAMEIMEQFDGYLTDDEIKTLADKEIYEMVCV